MKAHASSYSGRITTRGLQGRQLLRAACASAVVLMTVLAFRGSMQGLVEDAASGIVQQAVAPVGFATDIVWTSYIAAYALLLLAALALWIAAVLMTISPPSSRAGNS